MSVAEKEKYYLEIIEKHEANGVEFFTSHGVVIDPEVKIGKGTQILPGTILRGNTTIGENCVIGPNSMLTAMEQRVAARSSSPLTNAA